MTLSIALTFNFQLTDTEESPRQNRGNPSPTAKREGISRPEEIPRRIPSIPVPKRALVMMLTILMPVTHPAMDRDSAQEYRPFPLLDLAVLAI
jgi:hypothetical protein